VEQTGDVKDEVPVAVQTAVDDAVRRVEALVAADPDLVHGDAVEEVALTLPVEVAVELCEQTMQFVPDTVRARVFQTEHADSFARSAAQSAERDALQAKSKQRSQRAAATRAATLAAEAAAESVALKSATCPECFQLRAASGVCGCD